MQLQSALVTIALMVSTSLAFQFPDFVSLWSRQTSGPQFECHADCGYTILGASLPAYCTNSTWTALLSDCLSCANNFGIWQFYGDGVTGAAQGCGLTAVPSPSAASNSTAPSTSAPAPGSTSSSAPAATTTAAPGSTTSTTPTPGAASALRYPIEGWLLFVAFIGLVGYYL